MAESGNASTYSNVRKQMSIEQFKNGLMEYYQGEILGEAVMEQFLRHFDEPLHQAKIAALLQLETETKARLRPALIELGLPLTADDNTREQAKAMAAMLADLNWDQVMAIMCEQLPVVVERYREVADCAPKKYRELSQSMVVHEQSLLDFAMFEASGERTRSLDGVIPQLHFKLPSADYKAAAPC